MSGGQRHMPRTGASPQVTRYRVRISGEGRRWRWNEGGERSTTKVSGAVVVGQGIARWGATSGTVWDAACAEYGDATDSQSSRATSGDPSRPPSRTQRDGLREGVLMRPIAYARRPRRHRVTCMRACLLTYTLLVMIAVPPPVGRAAAWHAQPALHLRTIADVPLTGGASRFDYESLDQDRQLLFMAHLGAGILTVFNVKTNRVVSNIQRVPGVHGVLVVPGLHRVYASATDDNQIAVIDERRLRVVGRVPGGDYPDGIAYDPDAHAVFVSDESGGTDTVIDTRTDRRVATISLGGEAGNTQYDPGTHRIFVDVQTRNQLVAIDPRRERVVARYPLPGCRHDHGLLIDAPRQLAFVACDENARLLTVDLRTMKVAQTQTVGSDPDVLAFDQGQRRLLVAAESGILTVFQERDRRIQKVGQGYVATEAHSVAVDSRTHRLYLPLENVNGRPVLRVADLSGVSRSRSQRD